MAILTIEISALLCLYSVCPHVSPSTACTHCVSDCFMWNCRFGSSVCITLTVYSGIRKVIWIHSWMSYAVMFGLVGSNVHTTAFRRSAMLRLRYSPSHTHSHRIFSPRTRSHDFHFPFRRITLLRTLISFWKLSADWTRTNVICFRKVLVSREGAQLQLNTANSRPVRNISPFNQSQPATLLGILINVNSCINLKLNKRIGVFDKYIRGVIDCSKTEKRNECTNKEAAWFLLYIVWSCSPTSLHVSCHFFSKTVPCTVPSVSLRRLFFKKALTHLLYCSE